MKPDEQQKSEATTPISWRLKKGEGKRVSAHHPWIFSNQLSHSPKGIEKGAFVELTGDHNEFIAYGYGNPNSLISFRVLSWDITQRNLWNEAFLVERLTAAWQRRLDRGFKNSYRVAFSEADQLPGLVVDRFQLKGHQVLAFQVLTAGMEKWLVNPLAVLEKVVARLSPQVGCAWDNTLVVERKDTSIRKMEGLEIVPPKILKSAAGIEDPEKFLSEAAVLTTGPAGDLQLFADLFRGQKTGFFLDQSFNMQLVQQILKSKPLQKKMRILDLCCYVGHWSLQLAAGLKELGIEAEVSLVDVSASSLERAAKTMRNAGITFDCHEVDVLKEVSKWPEGVFDVIIVDPPAFAKSRKDLPMAEHAYIKLNAEAYRRAAPGGLVVSCSCSGLVDEKLFSDCLAKALRKAGREGQWLVRGGQGFDHPVSPNFPEGKYLKMFVTECL